MPRKDTWCRAGSHYSISGFSPHGGGQFGFRAQVVSVPTDVSRSVLSLPGDIDNEMEIDLRVHGGDLHTYLSDSHDGANIHLLVYWLEDVAAHVTW
ncbi:hypothetical protein HPB50_021839 [Hyalomma asiaticum]|uniref:Uncharacterized protein n=1 Tax=Hyalomma asiaticum TaxID=266040 RepID=A0ACB7TP96_HYAAI|nr:hypothetical protein HPB50_021839 [Hyalomma asiaticum]